MHAEQLRQSAALAAEGEVAADGGLVAEAAAPGGPSAADQAAMLANSERVLEAERVAAEALRRMEEMELRAQHLERSGAEQVERAERKAKETLAAVGKVKAEAANRTGMAVTLAADAVQEAMSAADDAQLAASSSKAQLEQARGHAEAETAADGVVAQLQQYNGRLSKEQDKVVLGLLNARPAPSPSFASRSVRRALLVPQANPGSRYRCGKSA